MKFLTISLAGLLVCAAASRGAAQNLNIPFMDTEEKNELKNARRKLLALERRIKKKDIPPIEFEFNKAVLRPHSKETLDMVADLLFEYPQFKLMVFGHTCDIGSDRYNKWLSQKRAESVKHYLIEVGLMGEFIKAKGVGESKPLVTNDSEENRESNRRVEFRITKRWWSSVF